MKTSIEQSPVRHSVNGPTMGTRYAAVFYANAGTDTSQIEHELFEAVDRVDRQMSTWKPASDLCRLNAAPVGAWQNIPPELGRVLSEGQRICRLSGGAFDIGVGDIVSASGFGAAPGAPDPAVRAARSDAVRISANTMLEVSPDGRSARRTGPVSLDLSGIAKGFGVDALARVLQKHRIDCWLVSIDGELRACGTKPDGAAWAVALERPEAGRRSALGVIELSDTAVATSGNYRHVRRDNERDISHTVDPRTGTTLHNHLASVTVLAKTCMEADALATALMVLGEDAGPKLAQALGVEAIFIRDDGRIVTNVAA